MDQHVTICCKAILFDMDGTLVDSTAVVEQGWAIWAARHGLHLESILKFSHGRPGSATMEHFRPGHDHTADIADLAVHEETNTQGVIAIPGATEFVQAVQGHPWAIVTSAWRTLATIRVDAAGLPMPEVLVPVDEISKANQIPKAS